MTNYDQLSDFVDQNELPLVIDYSNKEVGMIVLFHLGGSRDFQ